MVLLGVDAYCVIRWGVGDGSCVQVTHVIIVLLHLVGFDLNDH